MAVEYKRLNHITFNAPSGEEEKVRWFYGTILGLKEVVLPSKLEALYELLWFEMLDFLIHIEFTPHYVRPQSGEEKGVIMPGRHVAFEVKNLAAIRKDFEAKKLDMRKAVPLPDRDRFYLVDPFGNFFEFIEFYQK